MKSKLRTEIESLANDLKQAHLWVQQRFGKPISPNWSLMDYPDWDKLSSDFLSVIRSTSYTNWSERELSIVKQAVLMDYRGQRLLWTLTHSELAELAVRPYPDQSIRCYMLSRANCIDDIAVRTRIALHLFENDDSECNREYALRVLAGAGWSETEKHAKAYWESGDVLNRLLRSKRCEQRNRICWTIT